MTPSSTSPKSEQLPKESSTPLDCAALSDVARARSSVYQLLAMIFAREPSVGFLERLSKNDILQVLAAQGVQYQDQLWQRPVQERLAELAVEYTRLFIGPGEHIALQESVQRGEGQLWGEKTCEAIQFYAQAGYKIDSTWNDLPDHLSVELQFLGYLAEREAKCWQNANSKDALLLATEQLNFLQQHALEWMPKLAQQVDEQAQWSFYRAFAYLLARVLKSDSVNSAS